MMTGQIHTAIVWKAIPTNAERALIHTWGVTNGVLP